MIRAKLVRNEPLSYGNCRFIVDQVKEALEVVTEAHQLPFGFYFGQPSQVEATETEHLFNDAEYRFDCLLALAVNRASGFGGHAIGHGLPPRISDRGR